MSAEAPVKALLLAFSHDAPAAVLVINRLKPDNLCLYLPESAKTLVETSIQPHITELPRRWDWIMTPDPDRFMMSYQAIAHALPPMLQIWEIQAGELVVDMTGATPAMASAMMLAAVPTASRVLSVGSPAMTGSDQDEQVDVDGVQRIWMQGNPWDEAARQARHDACDLFNRGAFDSGKVLFRQIEARVSGGQKPLYRAFADLAGGYGLWERFQHRVAWDKLKGAHKALDMASMWGGPPGLKELLPSIKQNAGFLEKLVLDPHDVKEVLSLDLLAHARRRATLNQNFEAAMHALLRALEAFAQYQLFKHYSIKSWDVQPEQLPQTIQDQCRNCFIDDVDGKYKLTLHAQFKVLAGLGSQVGQTYQANWTKMKPFLDAAGQSILGHGFEPLKPERYHQLYDIVMKMTGVSDMSLPKFPVLRL